MRLTRVAVLLLLFPAIAEAATRTWTGAVNNLWSVGGNWSGGVAPLSGDDLVFPAGATNRATTNDLVGLALHSIGITNTAAPGYAIGGNAFSLAAGITTACCVGNTFTASMTLTASQTFTLNNPDVFANSFDLGGSTLTVTQSSNRAVTMSGSLSGAGALVVSGGTKLNMTGTSTFAGTITLNQNAALNVSGAIPNAPLSATAARLYGDGSLPAVSLSNTIVYLGANVLLESDNPQTLGILSTADLTLHGGTVVYDLASTTPGTGHDQLSVAGTVTLTNPQLSLSLPGAIPLAGHSYVLIANDGVDPVSGTFSGLPEGGTVVLNGITFQISYVGGTGNDVVLTVTSSPKVWSGAVNNLWSTGGNWNTGIAPVNGDELRFPDSASNRTMTNDLSGLVLQSVTILSSPYTINGNGFSVTGGMSLCCFPNTVINVPVTLAATQTVNASAQFNAPVDVNGFTVTWGGSPSVLSGGLIGAGTVNVAGALLLPTATPFSGTFTLQQFGSLNVDGAVPNASVIDNFGAFLYGDGTIGGTSLNRTTVFVGSGSLQGGNPQTFGILSTANFAIQDGTVAFDLATPNPGTAQDQLDVNGTVTLTNPQLSISIVGIPPAPGTSFVIIDNDGADPVSGTFLGRPQGATFTVNGTQFQISYIGGDGNDVVLTIVGGAKAWTGEVNNLWSVGGNWNGGVAPVSGDSLIFPNGAPNRDMVNDVSGLTLGSLGFQEATERYTISGSGFALSGGMTALCCVTVNVPITLTGTQTFSGAYTFPAAIDFNGFTLTTRGQFTLSGPLTGSGAWNIDGASVRITGTSTFTGSIHTTFAHINLMGSIANATLQTGAATQITGNGALGTTGFSQTFVFPGDAPNGPNPQTFGVFATGDFTLSLNSSVLALDLFGTVPGTNQDQIVATGSVTLSSNPQLSVSIPNPPPAPGTSFVIIDNDGIDPVQGTFAGLSEGATFTASGTMFRITYAGGTGNDVVVTVVVPTTTTLTSSKNPSLSGETVTIRATVTSATGIPQGTVTLREGATVLGTLPLDGTGPADFALSFKAGDHSLVATYEGFGMHTPSTSAPLVQHADKGNAAVQITTAPNPSVDNQPVTVTVQVTAVAPASGVPTGTVTISVDGTPQPAGTLNASGAYSTTLPPLAAGTHTISATYSGDAEFNTANAQTAQPVLARISIASASVNEGSVAEVVVRLAAASSDVVRVSYTTANGTATSPGDYTAASGTIEFAPGVVTQTIQIQTATDTAPEPPEQFRVVLSSPMNAVLEVPEVTVTIVDPATIPTMSEWLLLMMGALLAFAAVRAIR